MSKKFPSIIDAHIINPLGPWPTKSKGQLIVLSAIPIAELQKFLKYNHDELAKVPINIRGLRHYLVGNLPLNGIGGGEFHRIRREIVFAITGEVKWECQDLYGEHSTTTLNEKQGISLPPFLLHSYTVTKPQTTLLVVANTLFIPNDPRTHDTYSAEEFEQLKSQHK